MYVTTSVSGNFHSLMPFACIYHKSIGFRVKFNHCLPFMFRNFEVEELIKTTVNQNTVYQKDVTVQQSMPENQAHWATTVPHKVHDFDDGDLNFIPHYEQV